MVGRLLAKKLTRVVVVVLALAVPGVALASLSQGYTASGTIASGSLVSLDKKAGVVDAADLTNADSLFGVVVPPDSTSVSIAGTGANQVQVVTTGSVNALVSTEGGKIKIGDLISISSVAGVGQKVPGGKHRVIGTAQSDFDGTGSDVAKRSVKDSSGASHDVSIGQIPVVIAVADFTSNAGGQDYQVPSWLQTFSNQLAGKPVAPIRIVMAGIILLVTLVSVTVLLYAAVRNSIISIGRNPLSRNSVLRGLLEVVFVVLMIMVVAAGAMYLVIAK